MCRLIFFHFFIFFLLQDLQGSAGAEFAEPLPLHCEGDSGNSAGSHDGHVNKEAGDRRSAGLTSLPPRGSCKVSDLFVCFVFHGCR